VFLSQSDEFNDPLAEHDVERLFRVDDMERSERLYVKAPNCILEPSPENDSTENAFIQFWDNNLRCRSPWREVDTKHQPAYKYTIFRARFWFFIPRQLSVQREEKSLSKSDDPRVELAEKMEWIYDPAPFVLGSAYC
jgi:hypothetical protein